MAETWRPVIGYDGVYEVSDFGRVKRIAPAYCNASQVRIMRPWLITGYPAVELYRSGKGKTHMVHRLVAAAFLGICPPRHEVNHLDGNRSNPALPNLEYTTHAGNLLHAFATGLQRRRLGEENHSAKITADDVREIRRLRGDVLQRDLATRFGITVHQVCAIQRGRSWSHI
jgi:hypothetical protein